MLKKFSYKIATSNLSVSSYSSGSLILLLCFLIFNIKCLSFSAMFLEFHLCELSWFVMFNKPFRNVFGLALQNAAHDSLREGLIKGEFNSGGKVCLYSRLCLLPSLMSRSGLHGTVVRNCNFHKVITSLNYLLSNCIILHMFIVFVVNVTHLSYSHSFLRTF